MIYASNEQSSAHTLHMYAILPTRELLAQMYKLEILWILMLNCWHSGRDGGMEVSHKMAILLYFTFFILHESFRFHFDFYWFSLLYTQKMSNCGKSGGNLHIWRHWKITFLQAKITFSILIIIIIISTSPSLLFLVIKVGKIVLTTFSDLFASLSMLCNFSVSFFLFFRQFNYTFSLRRKTFHILL